MKYCINLLLIISCIFFFTGCPGPDPDPPPGPEPTPVYTAVTLRITEVGDCVYTNISSWFEVYNYGTEIVNIDGWQLRTLGNLIDNWNTYDTDRTFALPGFLIPPGGYALIRGKSYPHLVDGVQLVNIVDTSNFVPNWCGSGGFVELIKNGTTIDFVRFGTSSVSPTSGGWTSGAAAALPIGSASYYGYSLARDISNTDTDAPADWTLRAFGTPGGQNDVTSDTDADADGIPDCAETSGTTFAGLPLYEWGARTDQQDIFIEIDYMNSTDPGINPRREALDAMAQAFLTSPAGPIHIHFDVGDLYDGADGTDPADYDLSDTSHQVPYAAAISYGPADSTFANFYDYKYTYMDMARKQVFHYMLFANSQEADGSGGSSGVAEAPGNDVIISLGNWGLNAGSTEQTNLLINYQAATMMHEFGHNLRLNHGGGVTLNYKPNYVSIMNYLYQLRGLPTIGNKEGDRYYWREYYRDGWAGPFASYFPDGMSDLTNSAYTNTFIMDYSTGTGSDLVETNLNENSGLGRGGSVGVDWNGNGVVTDTGVYKDITDRDELYNTLSDYNDWANIDLLFMRSWSGEEEGVGPETRASIPSGPVGDDMEPIHVETLCLPEEPGK